MEEILQQSFEQLINDGDVHLFSDEGVHTLMGGNWMLVISENCITLAISHHPHYANQYIRTHLENIFSLEVLEALNLADVWLNHRLIKLMAESGDGYLLKLSTLVQEV